jgi:hypothetical protein
MNIRALFLFCAVAFTVLSCKKNDGDLVTASKTWPINIINAGADTLNFYQNGTRLNIGSNLLPSGQYRGFDVAIGAQNFQFKKVGHSEILLSAPFTIQDSTAYTLFVAGETADRAFLLRDTIPVVDSTAKIRFVNAAPDAGNLDFTINSLPTYKSRAFKSATPFIKVPSGKVTYSVYRQGVTDPVSSGTITLSPRITYTLFTKGLVKGTGTAVLGTRILVTSN